MSQEQAECLYDGPERRDIPHQCALHYSLIQKALAKQETLAERMEQLTLQMIESNHRMGTELQRLHDIAHLVNGNGKPPLSVRLDRLESHANKDDAWSDRVKGGVVTIIVAIAIATISSIMALAWTGAFG